MTSSHTLSDMARYDTIFFDLDGTITDSKPGILKCIRLALDQKGVRYTEAQLDDMVGPPFRVSMRGILGVHDDALIEELIRIYRAEYEVSGWRDCAVYPGIRELLAALKEKGSRLAVATSKPLKFTVMMLDELGLSPFFDFIGGAESDSSRDSKIEVIRYVMRNLGMKDAKGALMVGDRLYDIDGAKQASMDSAGALWGYGSREELLSHDADLLFETPAELGEALLRD